MCYKYITFTKVSFYSSHIKLLLHSIHPRFHAQGSKQNWSYCIIVTDKYVQYRRASHYLSAKKTLAVVCSKLISNKHARAMSVQVITHVITLGLHIGTHLVKRRCRNHMALAVYLPCNGRVLRADCIIAASSRSRASVVGNVRSHCAINNHSSHEVRVIVSLVVHNCKDLRLYTNIIGNVLGPKSDKSIHIEVAKDTVVKGSLVLVDSATGSSSRVRPVDLVSLTNFHTHAVLPFVRHGKPGVILIIVSALVSQPGFLRESAMIVVLFIGCGTFSRFIVLAQGVVLGSKVPVNIHRAQSRLPVGFVNRFNVDFHISLVSLGYIRTSLGFSINGIIDTLDVWKIKFLSCTRIISRRWPASGKIRITHI
mmetsp:Transcript_1584/g.2500  ORF Transcript_1584/g.2500 Transcript_1584/m.2500 type:complete len:367 (+) Transcript_1584:92-1192(+)